MTNQLPEAERASAMLAHLEEAGYARAEPSILQPAAIFLETSGEELRGRLFLTSDASGEELCLRPEYTIPLCKDWLAKQSSHDHPSAPAQFSYIGPVFRARTDASGEFVQAGLESFGRTDLSAADAEILALSLSSAALAGAGELDVTFGDAALFSALLQALGLSAPWQRRILRGHMRGQKLEAIVAGLGAGRTDHSGVLAALEGVDKKGARALVEDLLSIAGISSVGGRSASEIADRFLDQSSLRAAGAFTPEKRAVLESFLTISGDPDTAFAQMKTLASKAGLDLETPFADFSARLGFFSAHGLDLRKLRFEAGFVRNLDYYTGFMFEARHRKVGKPIIGGGRYDNLIARLNGGKSVPAVGAAIWMGRIAEINQ